MLLDSRAVLDDNLTVTSLDSTHYYLTVNLGENCRTAAWVTGFEELCNSRQTTGNIAGLTKGTRNLDDDIADLDLGSVLNHYVCPYREVVLLDDGAAGIHDIHCRALSPVLGLDDDLVIGAGILIRRILAIGYTLDHILEFQSTGSLHDGGGVICIPLADAVSLGYLVTFLEVKHGSVRNIVLREGDACVLIHDAKFSHSTYHNGLYSGFSLTLDGTKL